MNFLDELRWRGMLQDMIPETEELFKSGKMVTAYIGFDPTAPSLTIGNYVQIMLLTLLQRAGHQPIVLMGGATGRIGDPSFKDEERQLKTTEELDRNLAHQVEQVSKYLNFSEGDNRALLVNNYDFYKDMNVLDFLRDVGKTLTVNYMMSKESVKKRIETGISFTEFSYQLLQGYDFQCLFEKYSCVLQMGGSDQWGNITAGTEFVRRNLGKRAYALTTPLLIKADGKKFGKSEQGNLWLDPRLTSPYKFYQFWINADDADLPKFMRYFMLRSKEEVEALERDHADNPRELKRLLAEELTIRVHSQEAFESVLKVSELLFGKNSDRDALLGMSREELAIVSEEIPTYSLNQETLAGGMNILDLMAQTGIAPSKAEARRAVQGNAVSVNKEKISTPEQTILLEALLHGQYLMVENGKKNKIMVVVG